MGQEGCIRDVERNDGKGERLLMGLVDGSKFGGGIFG